MPIAEFYGGQESTRLKLNEIVRAVNALMEMRGDPFIDVNRNSAGVTVKLNLQRVQERMPKASSASLPLGYYQYTVLMMVAQNIVGWDYVRAHP